MCICTYIITLGLYQLQEHRAELEELTRDILATTALLKGVYVMYVYTSHPLYMYTARQVQKPQIFFDMKKELEDIVMEIEDDEEPI